MYWISTLGNRRTSHVFIGFSMLMLAACGGGGGGGGGGSSAGYSKSSANVSWTAPTKTTDGKPLYQAQIGGFVVYFGSSRQDLNQRVVVDDPTATSRKVNNLPSGQYYFAVSATNPAGTEGPRSEIVSVSVD